ncbi:MAG: DnaA N-terminal domain-containing protein [Bdellovibrionota bacterium]
MLPQAQFQNWVKLRLIRCDNHSVVVGVPNRFHQEWVKNNYSEALSEAIRHQTGSHLQLEFEIVLKEENHSASQSALPSTEEAQSHPTRPSLRVVEI